MKAIDRLRLETEAVHLQRRRSQGRRDAEGHRKAGVRRSKDVGKNLCGQSGCRDRPETRFRTERRSLFRSHTKPTAEAGDEGSFRPIPRRLPASTRMGEVAMDVTPKRRRHSAGGESYRRQSVAE